MLKGKQRITMGVGCTCYHPLYTIRLVHINEINKDHRGRIDLGWKSTQRRIGVVVMHNAARQDKSRVCISTRAAVFTRRCVSVQCTCRHGRSHLPRPSVYNSTANTTQSSSLGPSTRQYSTRETLSESWPSG